MAGIGKTLATILLLAALAPINITFVVACLILEKCLRLLGIHASPIPNGKTILISCPASTKGLHLARLFHAKGFRVVWASDSLNWLCAARFSNAVSKFYSVPREEADYIEKLLQIAYDEDIDHFLPVPMPSFAPIDSRVGDILKKQGRNSMTLDYENSKLLDDKYSFNQKCKELGLLAPDTYLVTSKQQARQLNEDDSMLKGRQFLLKCINYSAVHRLDKFTIPCSDSKLAEYLSGIEISEDQPWIAQQFLEGEEYASHEVFHDGKLYAHVAVKSSALFTFCESVEIPDVQEWVTKLGKDLNLNGSLCFDFIHHSDGLMYPIECNPRIHTAVTIFGEDDGLVDAMLGIQQGKASPSRKTYWLYNELWALVRFHNLSVLRHCLMTIFGKSEAVFSLKDPVPFFGHYHVHFTWLLLDNLMRGTDWKYLEFNIGKITREGGD